MDGSGAREGGGAMKPVYLRVCIALVLSATGLIMARFMSWKEDSEVTSGTSNPESSSSHSRNNDGKEEEKESLVDHQKPEILSMNSRLEELQKKGNEMELRFKRYCNWKDQEAILMEQKSMLVLEKSISVEKKLLEFHDELEEKNNVVKELEGQVKDLKANVDMLLEAKEDVLRNSSENSQPEVEHHEENNHHNRNEVSRRKRLCIKLKRCVGVNEKGKAIKSEERCYGEPSGTVEPKEEHMFYSRSYCSSV
ncbi:hypothetical protein N665_0203s0040 [Sinapis alba]|nr:hypothetical protein N665_0203s0040 [Sinapis alba]